MMQAPVYFSYYFQVDSFYIGSLYSLGISLKDFCILFSPQLQFILVMPSVVKGGEVVKEDVCS